LIPSDQKPEAATRDRNPVTSDKPETRIDPHQKKALNTALRILTRRDHSKYELVQKLKQRGFTEDVIDHAILSCVRFDYINDERTARLCIRQLKRKGYGLKRIRLELNKKGLRGRRIQGILNESVSEKDERESAERLVKKNIKRFEREKDPLKRRDKIYRFLHARGFAEGIISEILKNDRGYAESLFRNARQHEYSKNT